MSEYFERFPEFIQNYIYKNGWEELREVQVGAADVLFNSDSNLLLCSSTASGKTEAALFPAITKLVEEPSSTFGILYVAPLKSLINDQFLRLEEVLDESGLPVTHWHGDVAASHKNRALKEPRGILQITPESLESMLMNRPNDIPRLFGDLRYVILDEIHTLTGSDRGNQIICQLCRISSKTGRNPIRIGLSATIGDTESACQWLGVGSCRKTVPITVREKKTRWRLGLEHFFIQDEDQNGSLDSGYEYIYDCTKDRKCLVFSNSREETEYITATLRQIAAKRGERDNFQIHHGNLSASIREETETRLKNDEEKTVTCATVTLELGIDIGRLERIVQSESPTSVSSFLQRLGRSGRRDMPPEMMMVFREENPLPNTPLPQLIPWALLRAIAIIQLYLEERFIEPPVRKKMPFSLLFQQTLSVLSSSGEMTLRQLAGKILSLPPFSEVSAQDYKTLIVSMIRNGYIEYTETKGLIVGLKGEQLISSFKFYAVFKDSEDYTVRSGSDEIGTITTPPPIGDRFALAGKVWEVEELDIQRKLIYVHPVEGKMEISWPGDYGEIHTKILERMKKVLAENTDYPYLKANAAKRLEDARRVAANTGMLEKSIVHLGGFSWCVFPWLGTRSFRTLRAIIKQNAASLGISNIEYEGCYYIKFRMEKGNGVALAKMLCEKTSGGIDREKLTEGTTLTVFDKYDDFIPAELLRKSYAIDRMEDSKTFERINEIYREFNS